MKESYDEQDLLNVRINLLDFDNLIKYTVRYMEGLEGIQSFEPMVLLDILEYTIEAYYINDYTYNYSKKFRESMKAYHKQHKKLVESTKSRIASVVFVNNNAVSVTNSYLEFNRIINGEELSIKPTIGVEPKYLMFSSSEDKIEFNSTTFIEQLVRKYGYKKYNLDLIYEKYDNVRSMEDLHQLSMFIIKHYIDITNMEPLIDQEDKETK